MGIFNKNEIIRALRDSSLKFKKGDITGSLASIDSVTLDNLNPRCDIGWKVVSQLASIYLKQSESPEKMPEILVKSERLLIDWVCSCNKAQVLIKEKILKQLLMTIDKLGEYYNSTENKEMALACLSRHLNLFENYPALNSDTLLLMASVQNKASSIYLELKQFQNASYPAEASIKLLQREGILNPNSVELNKFDLISKSYYNLAVSYEKTGKIRKAKYAMSCASRAKENLPLSNFNSPQREEFSKDKRSSKLIQISNYQKVDDRERITISQLRLRRHTKKVSMPKRNIKDLKIKIQNMKEQDKNQLNESRARNSHRKIGSADLFDFEKKNYGIFEMADRKFTYVPGATQPHSRKATLAHSPRSINISKKSKFDTAFPVIKAFSPDK